MTMASPTTTEKDDVFFSFFDDNDDEDEDVDGKNQEENDSSPKATKKKEKGEDEEGEGKNKVTAARKAASEVGFAAPMTTAAPCTGAMESAAPAIEATGPATTTAPRTVGTMPVVEEETVTAARETESASASAMETTRFATTTAPQSNGTMVVVEEEKASARDDEASSESASATEATGPATTTSPEYIGGAMLLVDQEEKRTAREAEAPAATAAAAAEELAVATATATATTTSKKEKKRRLAPSADENTQEESDGTPNKTKKKQGEDEKKLSSSALAIEATPATTTAPRTGMGTDKAEDAKPRTTKLATKMATERWSDVGWWAKRQRLLDLSSVERLKQRKLLDRLTTTYVRGSKKTTTTDMAGKTATNNATPAGMHATTDEPMAKSSPVNYWHPPYYSPGRGQPTKGWQWPAHSPTTQSSPGYHWYPQYSPTVWQRQSPPAGCYHYAATYARWWPQQQQAPVQNPPSSSSPEHGDWTRQPQRRLEYGSPPSYGWSQPPPSSKQQQWQPQEYGSPTLAPLPQPPPPVSQQQQRSPEYGSPRLAPPPPPPPPPPLYKQPTRGCASYPRRSQQQQGGVVRGDDGPTTAHAATTAASSSPKQVAQINGCSARGARNEGARRFVRSRSSSAAAATLETRTPPSTGDMQPDTHPRRPPGHCWLPPPPFRVGSNNALFVRKGTSFQSYEERPGNVRFDDLCRVYLHRYDAAAAEAEKANVARDVVRRWRCRNPPGRFLVCTDDAVEGSTGDWENIGDEEATLITRGCLCWLRSVSKKHAKEKTKGTSSEVPLSSEYCSPPMTPLPLRVGSNDVLFTRKGTSLQSDDDHRGNVHFLKLCREYLRWYADAIADATKITVAGEVVRRWRNLSPTGRFLVGTVGTTATDDDGDAAVEDDDYGSASDAAIYGSSYSWEDMNDEEATLRTWWILFDLVRFSSEKEDATTAKTKKRASNEIACLVPGPYDVLFDKQGNTIDAHAGVIRFHQLCRDHLDRYVEAPTAKDKVAVAENVVQLWRFQIEPGRFLARIDGKRSGIWRVVRDEEAALRTCFSLLLLQTERDAAADLGKKETKQAAQAAKKRQVGESAHQDAFKEENITNVQSPQPATEVTPVFDPAVQMYLDAKPTEWLNDLFFPEESQTSASDATRRPNPSHGAVDFANPAPAIATKWNALPPSNKLRVEARAEMERDRPCGDSEAGEDAREEMTTKDAKERQWKVVVRKMELWKEAHEAQNTLQKRQEGGKTAHVETKGVSGVNDNAPWHAMETNQTLSENISNHRGRRDVVFGGALMIDGHVGSMRFIQLCRDHLDRYVAALTDEDRAIIAREVVQLWRYETLPGRFLASIDGKSTIWRVVGDEEAALRTSPVLRLLQTKRDAAVAAGLKKKETKRKLQKPLEGNMAHHNSPENGKGAKVQTPQQANAVPISDPIKPGRTKPRSALFSQESKKITIVHCDHSRDFTSSSPKPDASVLDGNGLCTTIEPVTLFPARSGTDPLSPSRSLRSVSFASEDESFPHADTVDRTIAQQSTIPVKKRNVDICSKTASLDSNAKNSRIKEENIMSARERRVDDRSVSDSLDSALSFIFDM